RDQVKDVASVQRQFVGLTLVDNLTERGRFGLQQRRLGGDFHDLADFADLKRGVDTRVLLHFDYDGIADKVLKSLLFHVNPILAREQVDKREKPVRAAGLRALFGRSEVGQRHVRIRHYGSRNI